MGIVMRRDGKPISHHIFSGNTVDVKAFKAVILDLKERFGLKRVIFVGDRVMVSKENIDLLEQEGLEYILGVKLRSLKEVREEVLARAGRYQKIKRIFHIRTSSILIVSVEHYFLFLRLFSFFLVATCVSR